ncbi:hypothetical protein [Mycobacterium sp. DL99]|uniref:hypothetical protein n=1 Tax=Mycobacterium sp. DL99 TaxID=2528957 RepID=UPI001080ACEC|nr:hypothetical protein [Mycobacterium sp. DL99]
MHAGVRPYLTAGIALVGAGVIATAPVNPPPQIHSGSVELVAAVENPVEVFAPVLEFSQEVIAGLIAAELSDPAPILNQLLENQLATVNTTGAIVVDGIKTAVDVVPGLPAGLSAAADAIVHGNPGQAPIEILNAVGTPVIQYVIRSVPSVEYLLQRPLAVAQALVPVLVESAISIPIYLGISYVKPLIDQAVYSIGEVLKAAATLDPGTTINAFQHGVKDVAMRTIDLANATAAVGHDTRQAIKTALQTQPVTPNLALERRAEAGPATGTGDDQDVAPAARVAATVDTSDSTTHARPALRSIFGKGNKVRPGQTVASLGDTDTDSAAAPAEGKPESPAATSVKSFVKKVKSGLNKPAKTSGGNESSGDADGGQE